MALTTYETPLDWNFDPAYVNSAQGIHYLAWRIGEDQKRQLAFWLIAPVIPSPVDINTLLPAPGNYTESILSDDVGKSGYTRSALPDYTIDSVELAFKAEVYIAEQMVIDGYR